MAQEHLPTSRLSKKLSWVLRHGAEQEGLPIQPDGFVSVNALLAHPKYSKHYTLAILQHIVDTDNKRRYTLRCNPNTGTYEIRANQGHSLEAVQAEHCLQRINKPEEVPLAVHGTYFRYWPAIRAEGLKRMSRQHVHFATSDKPCGEGRAISGFRNDCQLLIYLDVRKAMQEGGMQLYRSTNDVILCAGVNGCIPTEYFAKVVDRRTGQMVVSH